MQIVVGPVLTRQGGYAFDCWTPERGLSRGYAYGRIEDAYYAQRRNQISQQELFGSHDHLQHSRRIHATNDLTTEITRFIAELWRGSPLSRFWSDSQREGKIPGGLGGQNKVVEAD
jgi:hypothetical protein